MYKCIYLKFFYLIVIKLKNEARILYIRTNTMANLFLANDSSTGFAFWEILPSHGLFIKIRNLANKKVLDLSNNNSVRLVSKNDTKYSQDWFFDNDNKIVNRKTFQALTATDNDKLVMKKRTDGDKLQSWLKMK